MHKEFLANILAQNKMTSSYAFNKVSSQNATFRLNKKAASVGFIFRHIAETINLFPTFFGVPTTVQNTTIGKTDEGQHYDIEESRQMIENGFSILQQLVETTPEEDWLQLIYTPFFGEVPRLRLFAHILFHNSHHCGQISMTISKGSGD